MKPLYFIFLHIVYRNTIYDSPASLAGANLKVLINQECDIYMCQNDSGDVQGLFPRLMEFMAAEGGFTYEYVKNTWIDPDKNGTDFMLTAIEQIKQNNIDIVFNLGQIDSYMYNHNVCMIPFELNNIFLTFNKFGNTKENYFYISLINYWTYIILFALMILISINLVKLEYGKNEEVFNTDDGIIRSYYNSLFTHLCVIFTYNNYAVKDVRYQYSKMITLITSFLGFIFTSLIFALYLYSKLYFNNISLAFNFKDAVNNTKGICSDSKYYNIVYNKAKTTLDNKEFLSTRILGNTGNYDYSQSNIREIIDNNCISYAFPIGPFSSRDKFKHNLCNLENLDSFVGQQMQGFITSPRVNKTLDYFIGINEQYKLYAKDKYAVRFNEPLCVNQDLSFQFSVNDLQLIMPIFLYLIMISAIVAYYFPDTIKAEIDLDEISKLIMDDLLLEFACTKNKREFHDKYTNPDFDKYFERTKLTTVKSFLELKHHSTHIEFPYTDEIKFAGFSSDSKYFFISGLSNNVIVYDYTTFNKKLEIKRKTSISCIKFSKDNKYIMLATKDMRFITLSLQSTKVKVGIQFQHNVKSFGDSYHSTYLYICLENNTCKFYRTENMELITQIKRNNAITSVDISPDERTLMISEGYYMMYYDMHSFKLIKVNKRKDTILMAAYITTRKSHYISSLDNYISFYDEDNKLFHLIKLIDQINDIYYNDKYFITGGNSERIRIFDIDSLRIVYILNTKFIIRTLGMSPNGKYLYYGGINYSLHFNDFHSFKFFKSVNCNNSVTCILRDSSYWILLEYEMNLKEGDEYVVNFFWRTTLELEHRIVLDEPADSNSIHSDSLYLYVICQHKITIYDKRTFKKARDILFQDFDGDFVKCMYLESTNQFYIIKKVSLNYKEYQRELEEKEVLQYDNTDFAILNKVADFYTKKYDNKTILERLSDTYCLNIVNGGKMDNEFQLYFSDIPNLTYSDYNNIYYLINNYLYSVDKKNYEFKAVISMSLNRINYLFSFDKYTLAMCPNSIHLMESSNLFETFVLNFKFKIDYCKLIFVNGKQKLYLLLQNLMLHTYYYEDEEFHLEFTTPLEFKIDSLFFEELTNEIVINQSNYMKFVSVLKEPKPEKYDNRVVQRYMYYSYKYKLINNLREMKEAGLETPSVSKVLQSKKIEYTFKEVIDNLRMRAHFKDNLLVELMMSQENRDNEIEEWLLKSLTESLNEMPINLELYNFLKKNIFESMIAFHEWNGKLMYKEFIKVLKYQKEFLKEHLFLLLDNFYYNVRNNYELFICRNFCTKRMEGSKIFKFKFKYDTKSLNFDVSYQTEAERLQIMKEIDQYMQKVKQAQKDFNLFPEALKHEVMLDELYRYLTFYKNRYGRQFEHQLKYNNLMRVEEFDMFKNIEGTYNDDMVIVTEGNENLGCLLI